MVIIPHIIYWLLMLPFIAGCVFLGRYIAQGKGDAFIAGYNTASKNEQKQYDINRLRLLVSRLLYTMAVVLLLYSALDLLPEEWLTTASLTLTLLLIVGIIIVCRWGNEWVKKK